MQKFDDKTAGDVLRNIYVDNVQYCSNNEDDLVTFKKNATQIFRKAGMTLCEWDSNSNRLMDDIRKENDGRTRKF